MTEEIQEEEKHRDAEELQNMLNSDGWAVFRNRYDDIMVRLADIRNIPFKLDNDGQTIVIPPEQRTYEMQVRERTLLYLQQIIDSVLGDVQEYEEYLEELKNPIKQDGFIIQFDK